jgi:NADH dehydrogenase (ubiquinone) Fe-S protein 1
MASCAISIASDTRIHTKTNSVPRTRESISELLPTNHPPDRPIRDQGGECDLQDQAMIHGSDRGRLHEHKRSSEDKNAGPSIKTIMTRRTHRTRCTRFATEIAGVEVHGRSGRGKKMEAGTYISNSSSPESPGNVIDSRPVGALTAKAYASTGRPWELRSVETIDVFDRIGTIIRMDVRGSEPMRILPQSRWITDKTRFPHDGPKCQRSHLPPMRTKDQTPFSAVSRKKASSYAASPTANTDPGRIAGVVGESVDPESIPIPKNSLNRLGTGISSWFSDGLHLNQDFRSYRMPRLSQPEKGDEDDDAAVDFVLSVGSNPRSEASSFNVSSRRLVLRSTGAVVSPVGGFTDLTYRKNHFGNGMKTLSQLASGKGPAGPVRSIVFANRPVVVPGLGNVRREDGDPLMPIPNTIPRSRRHPSGGLCPPTNSLPKGPRKRFRSYSTRDGVFSTPRLGHSKVSEECFYAPRAPSLGERKAEMNIPHVNVSTPGACELSAGVGGRVRASLDADRLYVIGADSEKLSGRT